MAKYRVAQAGAGHRGVTHIRGFAALPDDFELVALCDIDAEKLARVAGEYGIAATYADADEMLAATKPDVFCFVTQPDVRLPMIAYNQIHLKMTSPSNFTGDQSHAYFPPAKVTLILRIK